MSVCAFVCVCVRACVIACVFLRLVHNANEKLSGGKMSHQSCKILLPKYTKKPPKTLQILTSINTVQHLNRVCAECSKVIAKLTTSDQRPFLF